MAFLLFKEEHDGQMTMEHSTIHTVVEGYTYNIFTPTTIENIEEKQASKHFMFMSFCDSEGKPSENSMVKRPSTTLLSRHQLTIGMHVGFFYRLKHHASGIRAAILKIVDYTDNVITVKVVLHKYVNQIIPNKFSQFVTHCSNQLSSNNPLPFNLSKLTKHENVLFVPKNDKSVSLTSDGKSLLAINYASQNSFFARAFYRDSKTSFDEYRSHIIKLDIMTKDAFLDGIVKNLKRIPVCFRDNLVIIHTKRGDSYIGIQKDDKTYGLSFTAVTKILELHELSKPSLEGYTLSIKPILFDTWRFQKTDKKTCSL